MRSDHGDFISLYLDTWHIIFKNVDSTLCVATIDIEVYTPVPLALIIGILIAIIAVPLVLAGVVKFRRKI